MGRDYDEGAARTRAQIHTRTMRTRTHTAAVACFPRQDRSNKNMVGLWELGQHRGEEGGEAY